MKTELNALADALAEIDTVLNDGAIVSDFELYRLTSMAEWLTKMAETANIFNTAPAGTEAFKAKITEHLNKKIEQGEL